MFVIYNIILLAVVWAESLYQPYVVGPLDALDTWIQQQDQIAHARILDNIAPFPFDPSARAGAICASPSRAWPDYYYTWTRDSALVINELVSWLIISTDNVTQAHMLAARINHYADFSRHLQKMPDRLLGEAKFMMDGTRFVGSWCNPQTDGPALRAYTAGRYAIYLLDNLKRGVGELVSMIELDLEYVMEAWRRSDGCDIWEEVKGVHYYTVAAQQRAMRMASRLYRRLGNSDTARIYGRVSEEMAGELRKFWNKEQGYIVATLDSNAGDRKPSNLDAQVMLAALHGSDDDEMFGIGSLEMLKTVKRIIRRFEHMYEINRATSTTIGGRQVPMGAAIGRYPEDLYDGTGVSRGNPWSLLTSGLAEYHYRLGLVYANSSGNLSRYLLEVGDRYMARVARHTDRDGTMYEQWNSNTGFGQGAIHLTWSYAAHLAASRARSQLISSLFPNY